MTGLSQNKKQFIDGNFYEGIGDELNREKFDQLATAEELHYVASQHNWDDGIEVLQWIAGSAFCSEATALMIFWQAQPQDYTNFKFNITLKNKYDNDVFILINTILTFFQKGVYKKSDIHFDPVTISGEPLPQVPEFMKQATAGEETYIYYDKKEVESWFGEEFENKVKSCDNALELFNIASFIKDTEKAKVILESPWCDKGIAVLLFWRLKTYAAMYHETNFLTAEIMEKVKNSKYPEVLRYDPTNDLEVKIKEPKPKWTIPKIMTLPV